MALVPQVDPQTGEVFYVEQPDQRGAPQMAPVPGGEGPEPLTPPQIPRVGPAAAPQPPTGPVDPRGFVERIGGPSPAQRQAGGGGFLDTLGQFATSNLGKNILGSLGVGLAGLRNPQDQGRFQEQLMEQFITGVGERGDRERRGQAMGALYGSLNEAQQKLAKGDLEGASKLLTPLATNPAVLQNPQAMQALLTLQAQLTQRMGSRSAVEALSAGPEPTSFRDFMKRASAAGMDLNDIVKLAPSMVKETKPQIIHSDKLGIVEYNPATGQVRQVMEPVAGGTTVKFSDLGEDARKAVNVLIEQNVIKSHADFLAELNHRDPNRRDLATRGLGVGLALVRQREAQDVQLKSERERSAEALRQEETYTRRGQEPPAEVRAAADRARIIQRRDAEIAQQKLAATKSEARAQARETPVREYLKAGGGVFELKSGTYREVSRNYRTKGELDDAEARGEISVIPDRQGTDDVQKKKNSLATLKDIREVGGRVFTKENTLAIAKQGAEAWVRGLTGTGELGRDVRKIKALQATVFDIAKGLGNDARISDADARFALNAMSLDTLFQSGRSFQETMDLVQKIFRRGLERSVRNERAPQDESIAGEGGWREIAPGVRVRNR